jgi:hypothetical protein
MMLAAIFELYVRTSVGQPLAILLADLTSPIHCVLESRVLVSFQRLGRGELLRSRDRPVSMVLCSSHGDHDAHAQPAFRHAFKAIPIGLSQSVAVRFTRCDECVTRPSVLRADDPPQIRPRSGIHWGGFVAP